MSSKLQRFRSISFASLFILVLFVNMFASWPVSRKVSAAAPAAGATPTEAQIRAGTFRFLNISTITAVMGGKTYQYYDKDVLDSDWDYEAVGYPCSSPDISHLKLLSIWPAPDPDTPTPSLTGYDSAVNTVSNPDTTSVRWPAQLEISYKSEAAATSCTSIFDSDTNGKISIRIDAIDNRDILFQQDSETKIHMYGNGNPVFTVPANLNHPEIYKKDLDKDACQDMAVLVPKTDTVRWYKLDPSSNKYANGIPPFETMEDQEACKVYTLNNYPIYQAGKITDLAKYKGRILLLTDTVGQSIMKTINLKLGIDSYGDIKLSHVNCEWSLFNPATWLFCPLFDAFQGIMSNLDTMVENELKLNTTYFDTENPDGSVNNTGVAFHNAWNAFYNMSLIVLVLIGLMMVFSQAFSVGPFDAYTIRKVMPRIIIAVIGIVLSWSIMQYLVDLSNIAGNSMRSLIYFPFTSLKNPVFSAGTLSVALLGGAAAIGTVGVLGMLAVFGAGAIALMVGVATIIFREALVMVLAVLSPIAIVCFILPNTQRIWKMWSSNFIRALVAFPIITGMIAVGSAMSRVFTAGDKSSFHQIAGFASVYAPFFMLPAAFRLAGGAIGSFNGVMKNKAAPAMAGLNKARNKQAVNRVKRGVVKAQTKKVFQGKQAYGSNRVTRGLRIAGKTNARGRLNSGLQTAALAGAASKTASIFNRKKFKESMTTAKNATNTNNMMAQMSNNPDVIKGMNDDKILEVLADSTVTTSVQARQRFADMGLKDEELETKMGQYESMRQALGPSAGSFAVMAQAATTDAFLNNPEEWVAALMAKNGNNESLTLDAVILGRKLAKNANRLDLANPQIGKYKAAIAAMATIKPQDGENMVQARTRTMSEQGAILREDARINTMPQELMAAGDGVVSGIALGWIAHLNKLKQAVVANPRDKAAENALNAEMAAAAQISSSLNYSGSRKAARTFDFGGDKTNNMGVMSYDFRDLKDGTNSPLQVPGDTASGELSVRQIMTEEGTSSTGLTAEEQERIRIFRGQNAQGGDQQNGSLGGPSKLF